MAREHPEQDFQIVLVKLLLGDPKRGVPGLLPADWVLFSTKNHGEQKSRRMHGIHRAMGQLKGMSDVVIVGPGPMVFVLELKRPPAVLPSGKLSKAKPRASDDQVAVLERLAACGCHTLVSNNLDEILGWLKSNGCPLRGRVM